MKHKLFLAALIAFWMIQLCVQGNQALAANSNELVLADFDSGDKPNNINGDFGDWSKDPNDDSQFSKMTFESDDAKGDPSGYSIRLEYDVDSPNTAYNGFWMKLNGFDATSYNTINFYIRGDATVGFSPQVKIELKDRSNQSSPYIIKGITGEWQKFTISFAEFNKVNDWKNMSEFVVVFDDATTKPKTGAIYIDHITFEHKA